MSEVARLADETVRQRGVIREVGAAADDEVVGNHTVADLDRRGLVTVHAPVAEPVYTADDSVIPDPYAVQVARITDEHVAADLADGGFL